jgi:folate-binding protein YgfZ
VLAAAIIEDCTMPKTPLYETFAAQGAKFGEYAGAETAANFGDTPAELEALRKGAGVYDLGWRAKLIGTGEDRVRWFNGMVTNNIKDLPQHHGAYTFLLSAQGQIQADMYVYNRGEYILVDTDLSQAARVREIFEKYIIMDDVAIEDASVKLSAIGLQGPEAAEVLQHLGQDVSGLAPLQIVDTKLGEAGISIVRTDSPLPTFEIWGSTPNISTLWLSLTTAGAKPVGYEAYESIRILAGRPRYGIDIGERDLPQETAQDRALNFRKGCYVGQEIVERIHSRGKVHRSLAGLVIEGDRPLPGAAVEAGGKQIGEIRSVTSLSQNGSTRSFALASLRRDAIPAGATLQIGASTATLSELPFRID